MSSQRQAFLSYARIDDDHSDGHLTKLCRALETEVRTQTTGDFRIFQDKEDIKWGTEWAERIRTSLNDALFIIPIVTPHYFQSQACQDELRMFLEREQALSRTDLILPIYFVQCDELEPKWIRDRSPLAHIVASRQYVDWRKLRFSTLRSLPARRVLAQLASQIKDALRTHAGDAEFRFEKVLAAADEDRPRSADMVGAADSAPVLSNARLDVSNRSAATSGKDNAGIIRPSWPDSLVETRSRHFEREKRFLAGVFTPFLIWRMKRFVSERRHVYLLIDSGTTLSPFFEELARQALRLSSSRGSWLDDVTIITNSLSGVDSLVRHGRLDENDQFTKLALNCRLLPGIPLPVYGAVTGSEKLEDPVLTHLETQVALVALRDASRQTAEPPPVFLSLLTGNWVRIRQTAPKCPVPLARGRGHIDIKQTLVDICDEAYVIAPLGKVFVGYEASDVRHVLEKTVGANEPSQLSYAEVTIDSPEKATVVNLVTTARERNRLLGPMSASLQALLEAQVVTGTGQRPYESFVINKAEALPHLMFPFAEADDGTHDDFTDEFPHEYTRTREFLRMFHVEDDRLKQLGL